ncbi:ferritin-like domain-containing protein [Streptomyces sp. NPDC059524]|uniref:ferritin-like domain-containing protein n=1 Tax=Streptomyces sp. NPDC059524 TaxID=3346856 RepID=UPI00368634FB
MFKNRRGELRQEYADWVRDFEEARERRAALGDPDWTRGATLPRALVRSVQRFQVGEDGDGGALLAKAARAGDPSYTRAARLFVAEEQNHARLLAEVLGAAGAGTLRSHWSDAVFVRLRRLLGLRLELLVLMIAEVVALRYYRALRDGAPDPLLAEVAGRILADEERHVPFHCRRLREGFAGLPRPAVRLVVRGWRVLLGAAAWVVAADHGAALRRCGVTRRAFVHEVVSSSAPMAAYMAGAGTGAAASGTGDTQVRQPLRSSA